MSETILYIGSRRYSSWSLRGWLAVRLAGIEASEHVIPLAGGHTEAVRLVSPSGLVPLLDHEGARIWDSLAILEYCAELEPSLWPADRLARAHARSISAEMHSGFAALRAAMPMNCCRSRPVRVLPEGAKADIARIEAIWDETRARFGGGGKFLFGPGLTGADIMFAPVVVRFLAYQTALGAVARDYAAAVRAHRLMAEWYDAAALEPAAWAIMKHEEM